MPTPPKKPKSSRPTARPVARMVPRMTLGIDPEAIKRLENAPEGSLLPMTLDAVVPLWILEFAQLPADERMDRLKAMNGVIHRGMNFCELMEFVLHKGSKKGDSAAAFNALAKSIALMAFVPGGIHCFGRHFMHGKVREECQR